MCLYRDDDDGKGDGEGVAMRGGKGGWEKLEKLPH